MKLNKLSPEDVEHFFFAKISHNPLTLSTAVLLNKVSPYLINFLSHPLACMGGVLMVETLIFNISFTLLTQTQTLLLNFFYFFVSYYT